MKVENVKTTDDIERYIEGCINDFEAGICDKGEMTIAIAELVVYIYKLALEEKSKECKQNKNKMGREIKFQGKRVDNGKWVCGDLIHLDKKLCIAGLHQWAGVPTNNSIEIDVTEVVPETVGQFTGLRDKNGFEIYEGDIVRYETDYDLMRFEVKWNENTLMWEAASQVIVDEPLYYKNGFIEVIGNIHDNPELIKPIGLSAASKSFTVEEVINVLEDCDTLDDAIMFFKEH